MAKVLIVGAGAAGLMAAGAAVRQGHQVTVQKLLRGAVVGHIAAPLARDQDLLTGLVGMLQHRYLMPLPHGSTRRHQACRTCAYDQHLCHLFSSQKA